MTKADGGAPPARKGVCFGVTQRMEMEREKKEQQVGPDPWAVRKVRFRQTPTMTAASERSQSVLTAVLKSLRSDSSLQFSRTRTTYSSFV